MTTHKLRALGQEPLTPGQRVIFDAAMSEGLPVRSCTCGLVIVGDEHGVGAAFARHLTATRRRHPTGGAR